MAARTLIWQCGGGYPMGTARSTWGRKPHVARHPRANHRIGGNVNFQSAGLIGLTWSWVCRHCAQLSGDEVNPKFYDAMPTAVLGQVSGWLTESEESRLSKAGVFRNQDDPRIPNKHPRKVSEKLKIWGCHPTATVGNAPKVGLWDDIAAQA